VALLRGTPHRVFNERRITMIAQFEPDVHVLKDLVHSPLVLYLIIATSMLLGWVSKYGVDAWTKVQNQRNKDRKESAEIELMEDKLTGDGLRFIIRKQDREIKALQSECAVLRDHHRTCLEDHARTETELEFLKRELSDVKARLEEYRKQIRRLLPEQYQSPEPFKIEEEGPGGE